MQEDLQKLFDKYFRFRPTFKQEYVAPEPEYPQMYEDDLNEDEALLVLGFTEISNHSTNS